LFGFSFVLQLPTILKVAKKQLGVGMDSMNHACPGIVFIYQWMDDN